VCPHAKLIFATIGFHALRAQSHRKFRLFVISSWSYWSGLESLPPQGISCAGQRFLPSTSVLSSGFLFCRCLLLFIRFWKKKPVVPLGGSPGLVFLPGIFLVAVSACLSVGHRAITTAARESSFFHQSAPSLFIFAASIRLARSFAPGVPGTATTGHGIRFPCLLTAGRRFLCGAITTEFCYWLSFLRELGASLPGSEEESGFYTPNHLSLDYPYLYESLQVIFHIILESSDKKFEGF
jgi:hypothetical protein